jgi:nitrite reductase/ring-hydroxylating ferredoxin subunit/uncharacterized membrane protein
MKRDLTERLEAAFARSKPITGVANVVTGWLNDAFQFTALRPLKLLLNGSWFGHPLHPVLTDIPIGAWTCTILLDLVALLTGARLGVAAGLTTGLGLAGAVATAATGLMDWMDTGDPEKSMGAVHAALNGTATILFAVSFAMRWHAHWQIGAAAFVVALAGYGLLLAGCYLGGAIVYHRGAMINRNAFRAGPADFASALSPGELDDGRPRRVEVGGEPVLLVRAGDRILAVGAVCSHYGAPLEEGKVLDGAIVCPWHGSRFALGDGSVREGPACSALPCYETRVAGNQLQVRRRE